MSVRRLNNPDQSNPKLGILFHKGLGACCGDTVSVCAYDIAPADLTAVTAITFVGNDGVNKTVTFASVSTDSAIRRSVAQALEDSGIDPYYRGDDFKSITIEGQRLRIIGTVQIISAVVNGSTVAATQKCEFATQCTYRFAFAFSTDPGIISDTITGGSQIGTTGGWATGSASTVAAAVTADLATEGYTLANTVTVTDNVAAGVYEVEFTVIGSETIYHNGESLTSIKCNQTFIA